MDAKEIDLSRCSTIAVVDDVSTAIQGDRLLRRYDISIVFDRLSEKLPTTAFDASGISMPAACSLREDPRGLMDEYLLLDAVWNE